MEGQNEGAVRRRWRSCRAVVDQVSDALEAGFQLDSFVHSCTAGRPYVYPVATCAKCSLAPYLPERIYCLRRGVPLSAKITRIVWPTG